MDTGRKETAAEQLAAVQEEIKAIRRELNTLEQRIQRLEVREEWIQDPGASGDAVVRD